MALCGRTQVSDYFCFFVTTTCHEWLNLLQSEKYFSLRYDLLKFVNKKYKGSIVAYVFMPNHIHLVIYFHEKNLSDYIRDFKKYTSTHIRKMIDAEGNEKLLNNLRYASGK